MTQALAPVTLVTGSEELLVERAVRDLVAAAGEVEAPEVHEVVATSLQAGQLTVLASPSLFGGPPLVVIRGIERLVQSDEDLTEAIDELLAYLRSPSPDACVVLVHGGGNGGKAIVTAAKKADASVIATPVLKKAGEVSSHRRQFVRDEFKAHDCTVSRQAVEVLIVAVGTVLRDLAAACSQLASDRGDTNRIDENHVMRYYNGVAEVKNFELADRLMAGHTAEALGLLRHAREGGAPVVLFPAALAMTLRQVALVASAPRGASAASVAAGTGVPDWKVKAVRETATHWSEAGLMRAIRAVAEADAAIKGGEADADYALERMLITIGRSRGRPG